MHYKSECISIHSAVPRNFFNAFDVNLAKTPPGRELRLILTVKITKRGCTGKSFRLGEGRLLGTESHKAQHVASTDTLLLLVVLSFPRKIVDAAQAASW